MIRGEILADFVKEFPWIYDKKDKGHKDCTVIGNAWQKVIEKSKKSQFWYGSRTSYSTICKPPETSTENVQLSEEKKKSGQGSKEVENKWW